MRHLTLLGARTLLGGYMAAHGAQKLFGKFGGYGLEGTGGWMESLGLKPGKQMAMAAGAAELGGGALMVLGLGGPVGPAAVASTMGVAASTAHRGKGPFAQEGGPELPLVNLAAAAALAASGPGRYSLDTLFRRKGGGKLGRLMVFGSIVAGVAAAYQAMQAQQQAQSDASSAGDAVVDLTDDMSTGAEVPAADVAVVEAAVAEA